MKRFHSSDILSIDVMDAALLAGAKAIAGDSDSLSDVKSLQFDEKTVIFSIANTHPNYSIIQSILLKHFLVFQKSTELFVPLSKHDVQDANLLAFLKQSLAKIKIQLDIGVDPQSPSHGQWLVPVSGETPKSHPFDFLHVIEALGIGLVEAMYGFSTLGAFEFSLERIRRRKKGSSEEIAPALWIDKILQDPQSSEYSTRINIMSRTGKRRWVISQVIANGTMQDAKKLTEWVVTMVPCVVDRKGLGDLVKELLRHAFETIDRQIWIKNEGWLRSHDSSIQGCVCGQELLLAPGADAKQYYIDIAAPRLAQSGTLERWNQEVLSPVSKNHILTGALQIGLASTMLDLVPGVSSCTFNFFGGAGRGKTLLLSTVASLFGNTTAPGHASAGRNGKSIIETFGSTELALQAKGQATSIGPMLIDEIGSNNFGVLDKFIYVTGNGNSRTRLSNNGNVQESPPKVLFSMTTGEVPIGLLVSRNAPQGVLDRGVDINIGGGAINFEGQDAEEYAFLPEELKKAVSAGIPHQYGTVAPAFVKALLHEMEGQHWKAELDQIRQQLVDVCPRYVSNDGPGRVLTRFALAVLAGRIALRNKVFSEEIVDAETLFNGVAICVELWIRTRWHYLEQLSAALIAQKEIPEGAPRLGLPLFRHPDRSGDMPTLMITKELLEKVFSGAGEVEIIGKRFKDDGLLFRAEAGRNTVGKVPHYHLRTEWLKDHDIEWSEDLERFVNIESVDN
ncbi:DUF927 domain-containing protein [Pseudomonas fulva]|uniref:DUF927 domain-containing protein n=1 Tax=Pseudomonas fulva TaxID=47880 RepID=A0A7S9Q7U3_9PSED|nr:DUF927 domain-containing protein [Pseudomonas fulva]QPH44308.1 DUF927 domain-containing protein [Pseudomonas fulva]QPH49383.1 DUF927 domain-containing protein [Pseudomonas fulva]